ncbi:MAG: hypothetical protein CM15mV41_1350 [Caudoviricetes sp.]|nr:MAG: hypothetical protein CM15mV41_1350 [Caudoviricetes sp.]
MPLTNIGLFAFGETVTNLTGDTAKVEQINLERGQETPLADLRYTIGAATTEFEVIDATSATDAPVPAGTFTIGQNYQFGSEIFQLVILLMVLNLQLLLLLEDKLVLNQQRNRKMLLSTEHKSLLLMH